MTNTPPSAKSTRPTRVHRTMHSSRDTQPWRFLKPRPSKKAANVNARNMLPTFHDLSPTQETFHPCTPLGRTSIPLSHLYLPSLDHDETRSPEEVSTVLVDRHDVSGMMRDDAPMFPSLDDDDDGSPRAVTPDLVVEDVVEDDESPRSARMNLHGLFEVEVKENTT